jgi:hypothetical protein
MAKYKPAAAMTVDDFFNEVREVFLADRSLTLWGAIRKVALRVGGETARGVLEVEARRGQPDA